MTPPIDIRADHLRIVQDVLHRHLPDGVKVWVFGSRASWATKDSSDLDLALDWETEIPPRSVTALEAAFEDSDLPYAVDIVDLKRINERFRRIVQQQCVALPENGSSRSTDWGSGGFGICPDWREMPFTEAFLVNPPTKIERGSSCAFVDMATVDPNFRSVRASEVREFRGGGARFRDGDTLMARITPCLENGKIARYCADSTSEPAHGSTEFIVVRGCPGTTDTEFAYYVTRSSFVRDYAIGQMTGTSGRQRVPTESLEHLTIAVPSIPEQQAIAHILGTLDDKIDLNRRMNATLEAMARALFRSWFVDFDPVRAKMEGRDTGLPKGIADLFPDRLADSELGEIPEGWESARLDNVANITKGRSYRRRELVASDTALVTLKSFARGGGYRPDGLKPFRGVYKNEQVVQPGEVIVACTDVTQAAEVVGRSAVVGAMSSFRTLVASLDVLIVRPKNAGAGRAFVYYLTGTEDYVAHALARTTGTTVLHLSKDAVASFRFALPPRTLVERFEHCVDSLRVRIHANASVVASLADLRDALLPKLVSGELRVNAREPTGGREGRPASVEVHGA